MSAHNRFQPLDGLRFIAFLPVFYLHACGGDFFYHLTLTSLDLFFILSGFLTGYGRIRDFFSEMVELRNRLMGGGVRSFSDAECKLGVYTMRYMWKKIQTFYPWHLCCLLWSVCIFLYSPAAAGHMPRGVDEWLWKTPVYLLLSQSWWISPDVKFCFNGVSWFLASLMFCYAVGPLILKGVAGALRRWVRWVLVFLVVLVLLIKAGPYVFDADGSWSADCTTLFDRNIHSWPLMRLLDYMVGMCAGIWLLMHQNESRCELSAWVKDCVLLLLSTLILCLSMFHPGPLLLILCAIWVYLVVSWHDCLLARILGCRLLVLLGGLVMPVYLTHNLVLKSMRAFLVYYGDMVRASMVFCCCFLFAWCIMWLLRRKQCSRNSQ